MEMATHPQTVGESISCSTMKHAVQRWPRRKLLVHLNANYPTMKPGWYKNKLGGDALLAKPLSTSVRNRSRRRKQASAHTASCRVQRHLADRGSVSDLIRAVMKPILMQRPCGKSQCRLRDWFSHEAATLPPFRAVACTGRQHGHLHADSSANHKNVFFNKNILHIKAVFWENVLISKLKVAWSKYWTRPYCLLILKFVFIIKNISWR